jgi:undecaprenyl-diphosphatase
MLLAVLTQQLGLFSLASSSVDSQIALFFRAHLTSHFAVVLEALTLLGAPLCISSLTVVSGITFAARRAWRSFAALLLIVPMGSLMAEGIKLVVQRPRPFTSGPDGEWGGYSFPSGHTIAAMLTYGFLVCAILPIIGSKRARQALMLLAGVLVVAVGFSRIALGAHYLTDVLASIVLGSIWICLCTFGISRAFPTKLSIDENLSGSP